MATLIATPATANADNVPTVDQVTDIMNRLTDPNVPSIEKNDIVTPPYDEHQARILDNFTNYLRIEHIWPINFTVTDIQPAPNNFAGATVANAASWNEHSGIGPVVLVLQNGHWFITHDSANNELDVIRNGKHTHAAGI